MSEMESAAKDENKIEVNLCAALQGFGMNKATAAKYAAFCTAIYKDLILSGKDLNDIKEGAQAMTRGAKYLQGAKDLQLTSAVSGLRSYTVGGSAKILQVIVDRYSSIAKNQGIELNECALNITKVSLDIATAGTGAVTAVTGWGAVVAVVGVVSTFRDSQSLARACFN